MALPRTSSTVQIRFWIGSGLVLTIVILTCLLALDCRSRDEPGTREQARPTPPSQAPVSPSEKVATAVGPHVLPSGLRDPQLQSLYHLSEGSEFVPLCALEVLATERQQTLARYFESYGLIPDPNSTDPPALPIGITEKTGPLHLVGFNCAACHVGKVPHDASYDIVIGAPGSFNVRQMYVDLIPWLMKLDSSRVITIARCLLRSEKKSHEPSTPAPAEEERVIQELTGPSVNSQAADASDQVLEKLEQGKVADATARANASSSTFNAMPANQKTHVLGRLKEKLDKKIALLKARTEALALVNAVGNLPYTMPGPGRVDAFMTALNLLNPNAKLEMDSPVAFPQLWGVARLKWRHWDNNTTAVLQRNMGQAIGVGALAPEARDQHIIATSLDVQALTTLEGLIQEIQPPRWPFAPPDSHAIAAGKEIYAAQCARCHEPLPDGSMREPSNDPADDPKTDAQRLLNFQQTDPVISRRWPDKSLIQVLALQLASVEKASKVPLELADKDPLWEARGKYGARTLQGVWATAPYLHNNSVLTLADLLKPAATRPKQFVVDYMRYDVNDVGFKDAKSSNIESERFDTAKSGNSNAGHEFGAALSDSDKTNLLAYLKQL